MTYVPSPYDSSVVSETAREVVLNLFIQVSCLSTVFSWR